MAAPMQHDGCVCGLTSVCFAKALVEAMPPDGPMHKLPIDKGASGRQVAEALAGGAAAAGGVGWGEVEAVRRAAARAWRPELEAAASAYMDELDSRGCALRVCGGATHVVFDLHGEESDGVYDELSESAEGARRDAGGGRAGWSANGVGTPVEPIDGRHGRGGEVAGEIDGALYDFLQAVGLSNLGQLLVARPSTLLPMSGGGTGDALTLRACVSAVESDRPVFLTRLKQAGIESLSDRQAFANSIAKALREGWLRPPYRGPFTEAGRQLRRGREAQPHTPAPQMLPADGPATSSRWKGAASPRSVTASTVTGPSYLPTGVRASS